MRLRTTQRLWLYTGAIIVAGALVPLLVEPAPPSSQWAGEHELVFVAFAIMYALSELRPMTWLSKFDGGEVTASWTFAFSMLMIAPASSALAVVGGITLLAELLCRKPLQRAVFNAAQITLSLWVGLECFDLLGDPYLLSAGEPVGVMWLAGSLVGGLVAFLLNSLLTCGVIALHQNRPLIPVVRGALGVNLTMDGLLLALAPITVVVALRSIVLLPLLMITIWVIFKSAVLALRNRHDATHDLLTGIPNRRYFHEQADLFLSASTSTNHAVVHIDLDGFKSINDRLGHAYGDIVLKEVADRLVRGKHASDVVARLGGDEFALLLDVGPDEVVARCRDLLAAISAPIVVEGVPLSVGGSFGVAIHPQHGTEIASLLHHADLAMYEAKTASAGVRVYEDSTASVGLSRIEVLSELIDALERRQLQLHYQPIVDLRTGGVDRVEALIRWLHPVHGAVAPDRFVPLVEQTELVGSFTDEVLRLAIDQAADWLVEFPRLSISVNVSARNFHDLRFPDRLDAMLSAAAVPARVLELEITESTVMVDPGRATAVIERLRGIGVQVSIDDFGTGYSSLANLRRLQVDSLKIDRSFITDMTASSEDLLIVKSIIDLAHGLGLATVAEGVETDEQAELLSGLGCDLVQGFLVAAPAPAEEIGRWMAERAGRAPVVR